VTDKWSQTSIPATSEYFSWSLKRPQTYLHAAMCSQTAGNILVPIQIKFLVSNGAEVSVPGHLLTLGD